MFKSIGDCLLSFDLEWVPDPEAAARLYGIDISTPQGINDALNRLWKSGGAKPENPQPYLKTVLCRIVSLCGIMRERKPDGHCSWKLVSLPSELMREREDTERAVLDAFLKAVGKRRLQLIGYNSQQADLPIIIQRAIVHGLPGHGFADRPNKPWEGTDYFSPSSDDHIDLAPILGRFQQMPSLHEVAVLSGIPGKIDASGGSVAEMWMKGDLKGIIDYNECDAFTTHLLWARMAHFAGLLSTHQYRQEQSGIEELLRSEADSGKAHLEKFLDLWVQTRS